MHRPQNNTKRNMYEGNLGWATKFNIQIPANAEH